jgi:hypothetical protein
MVYVDPLMPSVRWTRTGQTRSCHMYADTLEELHAFARRLGLLPKWFQAKPGHVPHYDLTANKRIRALMQGAGEHNAHQAIACWCRLGYRRLSHIVTAVCQACITDPCVWFLASEEDAPDAMPDPSLDDGRPTECIYCGAELDPVDGCPNNCGMPSDEEEGGR